MKKKEVWNRLPPSENRSRADKICERHEDKYARGKDLWDASHEAYFALRDVIAEALDEKDREKEEAIRQVHRDNRYDGQM